MVAKAEKFLGFDYLLTVAFCKYSLSTDTFWPEGNFRRRLDEQ